MMMMMIPENPYGTTRKHGLDRRKFFQSAAGDGERTHCLLNLSISLRARPEAGERRSH
jgi:hypothetical protein